MEKKNSKVPIAVLSCFLIAFIIQGVLKLCGVLVFEKILDWELFKIIDNTVWLNVIYYSLIVILNVYCLSFALTSKPYSNKWYHYVLIIIFSVATVVLRKFVSMAAQIYMVLDIILYVIIPYIIILTTNEENKLFKNNAFGMITTLSLNILLYLCYLGLGYWSGTLNSLLPIKLLWLSSSANFLIRLEMYVGIICLMLSLNILIQYVKGGLKMYFPIDIASDKAKQDALKEREAKKLKKTGK